MKETIENHLVEKLARHRALVNLIPATVTHRAHSLSKSILVVGGVSLLTLLISCGNVNPPAKEATGPQECTAPQKESFDQYLKESAVSREEIDDFLHKPGWAKFDGELGYVQQNYLDLGDGIDHSAPIYTFQRNGARTSFMYPDKKPRINTYGDSFTEGEQVSDGETWQEYLAAHLGEPIRNFGIGSYGVYQAYRRMVREETTDHAAQYLILYICCDDARRSLVRSRWASIYQRRKNWDIGGRHRFHGSFWPNVEMDLGTGQFIEKENLLPTEKLLYHMTEPEWMVAHLKDDLALQLDAYSRGSISDLDHEKISKLAERLDFHFDWNLQDKAGKSRQDKTCITPMQTQAAALLNRYGQRATAFVLDKARTFANQSGKKLLVVLNMTTDMGRSGIREDQEILDYLKNEKFDYFDMNAVKLQDLEKAKTAMTYAEFEKQYLVNGSGHYNPKGNHYFAYSIKDTVAKWLDPKPIPYQRPDVQAINFNGYLHGGVYH